MGHFGASYTAGTPAGNNNFVKTIVGGVRWVAGEGKKSDCSATVWSSFTRTVLVANANNPIGIDVAKDGKVYWSEIGNPINVVSEGYVKMYDPAKPAGNKTTVITIPTRADHGNSEDGVLGMSLQPGFDLTDPAKRNIFVYYSPRNAAWPTSGNVQVVGYNQISRWTLTADGTAAEPDSERVILRVPKAKIFGSPSGFPGGPTDSGPGHVGGAGLDFDSAGNLYLGVGDDVSPNASGHNGYTPMDYRSAERWDARKTAQNSADLRGKIIRITPKQGAIPAATEPGVAATYDIPAGNLFPVGTAEDPSRDLRHGLPPAVHRPHRPGQPRHHRHGRVLPRQLGQRRGPRSGRYLRVEPDQQGGQLRLAVLRRQQLGGQHHLPLEVLGADGHGPAVRLLAGHAAVGHPLRAGRRDPGRADQRRSRHLADADHPGDDLEEVRGRR